MGSPFVRTRVGPQGQGLRNQRRGLLERFGQGIDPGEGRRSPFAGVQDAASFLTGGIIPQAKSPGLPTLDIEKLTPEQLAEFGQLPQVRQFAATALSNPELLASRGFFEKFAALNLPQPGPKKDIRQAGKDFIEIKPDGTASVIPVEGLEPEPDQRKFRIFRNPKTGESTAFRTGDEAIKTAVENGFEEVTKSREGSVKAFTEFLGKTKTFEKRAEFDKTFDATKGVIRQGNAVIELVSDGGIVGGAAGSFLSALNGLRAQATSLSKAFGIGSPDEAGSIAREFGERQSELLVDKLQLQASQRGQLRSALTGLALSLASAEGLGTGRALSNDDFRRVLKDRIGDNPDPEVLVDVIRGVQNDVIEAYEDRVASLLRTDPEAFEPFRENDLRSLLPGAEDPAVATAASTPQARGALSDSEFQELLALQAKLEAQAEADRQRAIAEGTAGGAAQ